MRQLISFLPILVFYVLLSNISGIISNNLQKVPSLKKETKKIINQLQPSQQEQFNSSSRRKLSHASNSAITISRHTWTAGFAGGDTGFLSDDQGGYDHKSVMNQDSGIIYSIGGTNEDGLFNTVWMFDTKASTWALLDTSASVVQIPSMVAHTALITKEGLVYTFGGTDTNSILANVYYLNTTTATWTKINDVDGDVYNGLQYLQGVILKDSGIIYVIGGIDSTSSFYTSNLLTFNTNTNTWSSIAYSLADAATATTALARYGHSVVIDEDEELVYIYGGAYFSSSIRTTYLSDVIVYDIKANTWNSLTISGDTIPQARAYHTAVWDSHAKKMYVISGKQSGDALNEIYVLDPSLRTWTQVTLVSSEGSVEYFRSSHQSVYDTTAREIYTVGGIGLDVSTGLFGALKDVSLLSNVEYEQVSDWTPIYPASSSSTLFEGRHDHSFTYRTSTGKAYMVGGHLTSGACSTDVWMFDTTTNVWSQITPNNAIFTGRCGHTASFANNGYINRLMYVIGGYDSDGIVSNIVWYFDPDNLFWKQVSITSSTRLSARSGHTAVVESYTNPNSNLVYVIGGTDSSGTVLNDVWTYSGNTMTEITTTGSTFPARTGHAAVIDLTHNEDINIYVMGGTDSSGNSLSDVWVLNLLTFEWSEVTPASSAILSPRQSFSAVFYAAASVVYVFGGRTVDSSVLYNDVWKFDLVSLEWTDLTSSSLLLENDCVTSRYGHASIFNELTNVMYTVGGEGASTLTTTHLSDTWALSNRYLIDDSDNGQDALEWSELSAVTLGTGITTTAPLLESSAAVINADTNTIYFIGGNDGMSDYNTVWQLKTDSSNELSVVILTGTAFAARRDHTAVIDTDLTTGGRVYIIGGYFSLSNTFLDEIIAIDMTDGTAAVVTPTVSSGAFSARSKHTAHLISSNGGDIYIIGGTTDGSDVVNEVWKFSTTTSTLSPMTTTGATFTARAAHTCVYDAVVDSLYIIGGYDSAGTVLGDVYKLTVSSAVWTAVTPVSASVSFLARQYHTAAYDSVNGLIYVIGGINTIGEILKDVWTFDVTALVWKQLAVPGDCFTSRYMHTTVMDTYNGILYTTGGQGESGTIYSDTWQLFTQSHAEWAAVTPVYDTTSGLTARQYHSSVLDTTNEVIYIMGGEIPDSKIYAEIWTYNIKTSYLRQLTATVGASIEGHVSVIDNSIGVIYTIGGFNTYTGEDESPGVLAFDIESVTSSTVTTTGDTFSTRIGHAAVIDADNKSIYVFGGSSVNKDVWKLVYTYNTATSVSTGVWTQLSPTATGTFSARSRHTAVFDEGSTTNVYIIGGVSSSSSTVLNDVVLYDINAASFTALTPSGDTFPARAAHTSVIDHYSGLIYVVDGYDNTGTPLSDAWVFDIANMLWTQLYTPDTYTARAAHTSVMDITAGVIYNVAGFNVDSGVAVYNSDMWSLSGLNVNAPTVAPTSFPTLRPTRTPTYAPSYSPTEEPTCSPTVEPSYKPSVEPTIVPSKSPSETPTYKPSVAPTYTPTRVPTLAPSRPTVSPTLARPVTTIEITQYIDALSIYPEDLVQSTDGQTAFLNTVAEVLVNNDVESVTLHNATLEQKPESYLNGTSSVSSVVATLLASRSSRATAAAAAARSKINNNHNNNNNKMALEGLVDVVVMRYSILMRTPAVGSAQTEYNDLLTALQTAIADGSFLTDLVTNAAAYGLTDFGALSFYDRITSAYSTPVTPPTYTPTQAPNNNKPSPSSSSLSAGAIAGIAVAVVIIGLCLIGLCVYHFWCPAKKREVMAPQSFYLDGEEEQSSFKARSTKRGGLRGSIAYLRGSFIGNGGGSSPKKSDESSSTRSNNRNSVNTGGGKDQFGVRASILVDANGNSTKPPVDNNNTISMPATSPLHSTKQQQDIDSALRLSTLSPQISPRENDGLVSGNNKYSPRTAAEEKA